jgi:hypothetical protein
MEATSRPLTVAATPVAQALSPSADSRLADGVLVEASVLARLLGLKLLTLEGTVLLSPAQVHNGQRHVFEPPKAVRSVRDADAAIEREQAGSTATAHAAREGGRSSLAAAELLLEECSETLRQLRAADP